VDIAPFDPATDPVREARAIVKELRKYDESLFEKPRWLVINKIDLVPEAECKARVAALVKGYGRGVRHFVISAIDGRGCKELTYAIMEHLDEQRSHENPDSAE
jgi:GTP-binding protein